MKSVCILVQNPYDIDIRVRRKAEALVGAGYSVDAIALRSADSNQKEYTLNGVKVYTISLGKMRGSLPRYAFEYFSFFVLASWKLARLMRRRRYAVIDVNTLPDFLVFAAWYARRKGARLVLDMHEITPEFFMSKYGVDEKHWLVRLSAWLERVSMLYADQVLTINEPIQKLLESRGLASEKSTIIMNAADEAIFNRPTQAVEKASAFVMMYHGTLTKLYGLDIAIEALHLAVNEIPEAELWILGHGPEKPSLQALSRRLGVESRVKLIERVLPNAIPDWLQKCDVGVLATRSDVFLDYSFSNKLSEYILMRKGVISSRLRTIRHYFSEDALAFFEPNSPADLARQMVIMCRNPELRLQRADKARQEYAPIRWEVMKGRYLQMMNELAGRRGDFKSRSRASELLVNAK